MSLPPLHLQIGGSAGGGGGAAAVKSGGGGIGGGSSNKLGDRMLQLNKGFAKWLSEQINKNPYSTWVDGVQVSRWVSRWRGKWGAK